MQIQEMQCLFVVCFLCFFGVVVCCGFFVFPGGGGVGGAGVCRPKFRY